ncbi:MAG: hypothetical protein MSP08_00690 [Clostridiales bacterium]|nr:hypothetical protein [Clostridiales bacterium]MCI6587450.1 hypothetical protein [Clostridiales bacterium]MCI7702850.1 hypothetical protein [Clostridiales bacterium]MDY3832126.1 hypothetical protein [Candidatus Ventricola sp.]
MKDVLSRLRAALTPQAVVLLAAALLLCWLAAASQRTGALPLETRLARTLSCMEGAGRVEVTIRTREVASSGGVFGTSVSESVPCGAVVVAQGAQDPLVEMELRQAVCALLGLPASSVSVVTGGE